MIIALRIFAFVLTGVSAVVLFIALRILARGQRNLAAMGINGSIPLDLKARMIVWAWAAVLVIGIILIYVSD